MVALIISLIAIIGIVITVWYGIKMFKYPNFMPLAAIQIAGWLKGASNNMIQFAIAQARLESANFTSDLFKQGNNMFGIQANSRIPDKVTVKGIDFAKYPSYLASAKDYFTLVTSQYGFTRKMSWDDLLSALLGNNTKQLVYPGNTPDAIAAYTTGMNSFKTDTTASESKMLRNFILVLLLPAIVLTILAFVLGGIAAIKKMFTKKKK